jgi:threonine aldolase
MKSIDLRSDTITQPTPEMRNAMAEAVVGDDVFGEDPTVIRLQEMAAEMLGKEAGLFVASGTMANLICELTHCQRGDEMLLGDQSHVFFYEQGGSASIGGIHSRTITNNPDGTMDLSRLESAIRPDNIHFPRTRLIVLENTHNRCGGRPISADYMTQVGKLAKKYGLQIHVDGARLFNAAIALDITPDILTQAADSVSICLSKGLGAPAGSVVCGSKLFIDKALRIRKVIGGGMRQSGILAAAGIVALTRMTQRLEEDHRHARLLAMGLSKLKGIDVAPDLVKTNMVFFTVTRDEQDVQSFTERLKSLGVLVLPTGPRQLRAVTHFHVTGDDIDQAVEVFKKALS